MSLEDHLGDILRKAREGKGVAASAAAAALSISAGDYAELEQSGTAAAALEYSKAAALLDLDAGKLRGIGQGWAPPAIDTSVWRELRMISTTQGGNTVNCYLVWDEVTRDAALFDTGWEAAPIFRVLERNQLQLRHLFITHTHADHVAALEAIRARVPKVKLHSSSKNAPPDQRNRANDFIHLGSLRVTNRDTSGHAEDGVTYVVGNFPDDAPNVAVAGDAIFAGSIGGARGQVALAKEKIRQQIFSLPRPTLICPGHGPLTTVELEAANNPFF